MDSKKIMVYVADDLRWTKEALHLASALARNTQSELVLVKMIEVQHLSYLSTEFGYMNYSEQDDDLLREYQAIAEDYGIEVTVQPFQYYALADALVDAADYVESGVVFATLPTSWVSAWRKFQLWNMERRMNQHQHQLFTLEQPHNNADWTPIIQVKPAGK